MEKEEEKKKEKKEERKKNHCNSLNYEIKASYVKLTQGI